jgi:hypothetical protein
MEKRPFGRTQNGALAFLAQQFQPNVVGIERKRPAQIAHRQRDEADLSLRVYCFHEGILLADLRIGKEVSEK